jgi:hypothetical protein
MFADLVIYGFKICLRYVHFDVLMAVIVFWGVALCSFVVHNQKQVVKIWLCIVQVQELRLI